MGIVACGWHVLYEVRWSENQPTEVFQVPTKDAFLVYWWHHKFIYGDIDLKIQILESGKHKQIPIPSEAYRWCLWNDVIVSITSCYIYFFDMKTSDIWRVETIIDLRG